MNLAEVKAKYEFTLCVNTKTLMTCIYFNEQINRLCVIIPGQLNVT